MVSGNEKYISILLSGQMLISVVGMIIITIAFLKKGRQYSKPIRRLLIALLIIALGFSVYLLYLAFAFGNPHPPVSPVPIPWG